MTGVLVKTRGINSPILSTKALRGGPLYFQRLIIAVLDPEIIHPAEMSSPKERPMK